MAGLQARRLNNRDRRCGNAGFPHLLRCCARLGAARRCRRARPTAHAADRCCKAAVCEAGARSTVRPHAWPPEPRAGHRRRVWRSADRTRWRAPKLPTIKRWQPGQAAPNKATGSESGWRMPARCDQAREGVWVRILFCIDATARCRRAGSHPVRQASALIVRPSNSACPQRPCSGYLRRNQRFFQFANRVAQSALGRLESDVGDARDFLDGQT
jgi:hypothetical protein